jgi:hypothetical protein
MVADSVTSRDRDAGQEGAPIAAVAAPFFGAAKRRVQPTSQDGSLQMLKYLGRGSSAVVSHGTFNCPQKKETKQVAVKQIHTGLLDDPQVCVCALVAPAAFVHRELLCSRAQ